MNREEAFLILDVADSSNWYAGPVAHSLARIPPEKRPTVLQTSRDAAEGEVLRLQAAHPEGRFVLFTASHMAVQVTVATHVNLKGEPMYSTKEARLASLDDGVPF